MLLGSSFLVGTVVTEAGGGGPDMILDMSTVPLLVAVVTEAPRLWMPLVLVPPPPPPRVGMVPVDPRTEAPRLVTLVLLRIGVWPVKARPTPDSLTRILLCLEEIVSKVCSKNNPSTCYNRQPKFPQWIHSWSSLWYLHRASARVCHPNSQDLPQLQFDRWQWECYQNLLLQIFPSSLYEMEQIPSQ